MLPLREWAMMMAVDSWRGLSPIRMICGAAAFSSPAIFPLDWPEGGPDWVGLVLALSFGAGFLFWALSLQRWHPPLVIPAPGPRRRQDPWPIGPWRVEIPNGTLTRARGWGRLAALGCFAVAALNATALNQGTAMTRVFHVVSMVAAVVLGGFAFRARVDVSGGEVREYGLVGDHVVICSRWREVVVSHIGPVDVWAPQLDDDSPRGYVLGRCARLALSASRRSEEDQGESPAR